MPNQKPIVVVNGITKQLTSTDALLVGTGIDASVAGALAIGATTATSVTISTAATQRMVVAASGNVGIGTAAPTATFSVGSSGTERFRVDGATGRIVEYSDGVPANGEVLIGNGTNFVKSTLTAGTNIAVTPGAGTISLGLTGTVGVANGGTGTATAFTLGSVVFAGAAGVYTQDNANFFWDDTTNRLGIGTNAPGAALEVANSDALVYGLTVGRGGGAVSSNTAVGASALAANAAGGTNNVAVGLNALAINTIGTANTALGRQTLAQNITTSGNTAVGYLAQSKSSGGENTSVGVSSLDTNTGIRCVAVGMNALQANTGSNCVAVGYSALDNNTGNNNVAVGLLALSAAVTGGSNVAVGNQALLANTSGVGSVAVGNGALQSATTGRNVGVGLSAGINITTGGVTTHNTALGTSALGADGVSPGLTGDGNVAVGHSALGLLTGATSSNTAVGADAGAAVTTGQANTIVGNAALFNATTALQCVVIGSVAATAVAAGVANANSVAVGYNAEVGTTSVGTNTVVGAFAGGAITSGTNLTCIGFNAEPNAGTSTNEITLGSNVVGTILRCVATTITAISDQRDKAEIQDLSLGLDFLKTVHPVQFKWDRRDWYDDGVSDGSKKQDKFEPGFIAQELDAAQTAANAEWLALALKGNPDRWEATPLRLFPIVVKACQELAAQAAAATARAIEAERRLDALEAAIAALQTS